MVNCNGDEAKGGGGGMAGSTQCMTILWHQVKTKNAASIACQVRPADRQLSTSCTAIAEPA